MKKTISCSVVGARGYAGLEAARLLLAHPNVNLTHCFATSSFELPLRNSASVACLKDDQLMGHLTDVVFLATPAEVSCELAPKLLEKGARVIDLSGAFRLKSNDYEKWYGFAHSTPQFLKQAQYGLVPFVGPSTSPLIANPGCYATAIEMALIPLVKAGLIDTTSIVIDAKSGTTGAGKKASEGLLYSEVDGDCLPYKVGRHQHFPEIVEAVESFAGEKVDAHFSTSLLPVRRGITAAIYAKLVKGDEAAVMSAYKEAFKDYPLVSFGPVKQELLSVRRVVGTARTHIAFEIVDDKLYVFSVIDNLLKGAASQAVENLNRLIDRPVETGLGHLEALA